jgi:preprotein translocase subunit Sss1
MCLNVVGLTLSLIGAVGLSVSTLFLMPIRVAGEIAETNATFVKPYKIAFSGFTFLIAIGFILQLVSLC